MNLLGCLRNIPEGLKSVIPAFLCLRSSVIGSETIFLWQYPHTTTLSNHKNINFSHVDKTFKICTYKCLLEHMAQQCFFFYNYLRNKTSLIVRKGKGPGGALAWTGEILYSVDELRSYIIDTNNYYISLILIRYENKQIEIKLRNVLCIYSYMAILK